MKLSKLALAVFLGSLVFGFIALAQNQGTRARFVAPPATSSCTGDGCVIGDAGVETTGRGVFGGAGIVSDGGVNIEFGGLNLRKLTAPNYIVGWLPTAVATSAVPNVAVIPGIAYTGTDCIFGVGNSNGTLTWCVQGNGDTSQISGDIITGAGADIRAARAIYSGTTIAFHATAPTATTACTTPTITHGRATSFQADVGTSCAGVSTFVIGLPTTTNGWNCVGNHLTSPATRVIAMTAQSTTSITMTNFSRTLGTAVDWADADDIAVNCVGR